MGSGLRANPDMPRNDREPFASDRQALATPFFWCVFLNGLIECKRLFGAIISTLQGKGVWEFLDGGAKQEQQGEERLVWVKIPKITCTKNT